MSLRIRLCAAAIAAAIVFTAGCNKKPEETTLLTTTSETTAAVTETTTEETTTEETEATESSQETEPAQPTEYGSGAFSVQAGNYIFKNSINVDTAIHSYEGVKGLDSGWHGSQWIDITQWLTEFHSYKIDDKYLKCASASKRYNVVSGKNDVVIKFVPVKEIGTNTYDGFDTPAEVPVTLVNIEVTLKSGFKIVIAGSGNQDDYGISGSGRGWFMSHEQIAAAEYLFELLDKGATSDPLADKIDHEKQEGTNIYTF